MEMGWCEQYEIVMYFNEGGRTAFFCPLGGCLAERFLACPAAKKLPRMPAVKLGEQPHRAEVHEREAKNRLGPAWKSMAGDVHSGGQDWHPSAGMRYRLWESEWA